MRRLAKLDLDGQIRLSNGTEQVAIEATNGGLFTTSKVAVHIKGSTKTWWVSVGAFD
jgi:hypothetical protein